METALIHKVEAGLIAMEEGEFGGGGEPGEGGGDAAELVGGVLGVDGVVEEAGFDGPGAAHAPVGGGHFLDHAELDPVGGGEAVEVVREQSLERLARFVAEDYAIGEQAVADGILAGDFALAFGGDRASGFGSIGSGRKNSSE